eukprot:Sspe_Gene.68354::Locus_40326_Transcript_1_1_Confidence_1.000_Length_2245::g.68354::m.68354
MHPQLTFVLVVGWLTLPCLTALELVSYYQFENSPKDEKGVNNLRGNVGYSKDCKCGTCAELGRSTISNTAPYNVPQGGDSWSLSIWVYPVDVGNRGYIHIGSDERASGKGLAIGNNGNGRFEAYLYNYGNRVTTITVPRQKWFHAAATYDSGELKLHFDGVLVGTYRVTFNLETTSRYGGIVVGGRHAGGSAFYRDGKYRFDEAKVVKGVATVASMAKCSTVLKMFTDTPTLTMTHSSTESRSLSPTASISPTASLTSTSTATRTHTSSLSGSVTKTATESTTPSRTITSSRTSTLTLPPTPTLTEVVRIRIAAPIPPPVIHLVTVVAASALPLAAASGPAAARLILINSKCNHANAHEDDIPLLLAPLRFNVASSSAIGALLGNLSLIAAVGVMYFIGLQSAGRIDRLSRAVGATNPLDVQAKFRFPSMFLVLLLFLYQGTIFVALRTALYPRGIFGAIGTGVVVLGVIGPCAICRKIMRNVPLKARYLEDTKTSPLTSFLAGPGEWVSRCRRNLFVARYGGVLNAFREPMSGMASLEFGFMFLLACCNVGETETAWDCGQQRAFSALVYCIYIGTVLYTRPFCRPRDNFLVIFQCLLQTVALVLMCIAFFYDRPQHDGLFKVSSNLLLCAVVVILAKVLLDVVTEIYLFRTKRRDRLQQEEYEKSIEWALDADQDCATLWDRPEESQDCSLYKQPQTPYSSLGTAHFLHQHPSAGSLSTPTTVRTPVVLGIPQ